MRCTPTECTPMRCTPVRCMSVIYCGGVDVSTRCGNWNGYKWQPFGGSWCCWNAAGMLWWCHCCIAATTTAGALPMLLGAKQGQDVYLAGQLLPSFLDIKHN